MEDRPVSHRLGAKLLVESDRRLVPIEHRPFHSATSSPKCPARKKREQLLSHTQSTKVRPHKYVFKIKIGQSSERPITEEIDCKGGWLLANRAYDRFSVRFRT